MNKISVITVTYNCQESIGKTMKSVLTQTYQDMEYLIIDGNSVDDTIKIARLLANFNTKIYSELDNGIFDAMNKGIEKATGDWIIFMNAGDTFADIDVCSKIFCKDYDKEVGVVFGNVYSSDNGTIKEFSMTPFFDVNKKLKGMGICHQSIFMRINVAKQYKFDVSYKLAADYDMIKKVYDSGWKFVKTPVYVAIYDRRGVSSSNMISQF